MTTSTDLGGVIDATGNAIAADGANGQVVFRATATTADDAATGAVTAERNRQLHAAGEQHYPVRDLTCPTPVRTRLEARR